MVSSLFFVGGANFRQPLVGLDWWFRDLNFWFLYKLVKVPPPESTGLQTISLPPKPPNHQSKSPIRGRLHFSRMAGSFGHANLRFAEINMGMGQNLTTRGPQVLVLGSTYQGNPFWGYPIFGHGHIFGFFPCWFHRTWKLAIGATSRDPGPELPS